MITEEAIMFRVRIEAGSREFTQILDQAETITMR